LIIGGSHGAHSINMAVIATLKYLKDKDDFAFIHQSGIEDEKEVKDVYSLHKIENLVQSFFTNMAPLYEKSDLMICRAGATTIAEITALGKAAIYVPFPYAADNHQVLNAQTLERAEAGEMILQNALNKKVLADRIEYYASNRHAFGQMELKAKEFGKLDAAYKIVEDCYRLIKT